MSVFYILFAISSATFIFFFSYYFHHDVIPCKTPLLTAISSSMSLFYPWTFLRWNLFFCYLILSYYISFEFHIILVECDGHLGSINEQFLNSFRFFSITISTCYSICPLHIANYVLLLYRLSSLRTYLVCNTIFYVAKINIFGTSILGNIQEMLISSICLY